ncbi:MAG: hypothetical protein AAF990_02855 [Bacteroidota bacterium]
MKKRQLVYTMWMLFATALFLTACGDGTDSHSEQGPKEERKEEVVEERPSVAISADQLQGYWEVLAAKRNGKNTESLDDAYFQFQEDGQMETNIMGEPMIEAFTLEGAKITQAGAQELLYMVERFEDSLMVLSTDISSYHFQFQLKKGTREDQEEEPAGDE